MAAVLFLLGLRGNDKSEYHPVRSFDRGEEMQVTAAVAPLGHGFLEARDFAGPADGSNCVCLR
jgi:hypothetical protein